MRRVSAIKNFLDLIFQLKPFLRTQMMLPSRMRVSITLVIVTVCDSDNLCVCQFHTLKCGQFLILSLLAGMDFRKFFIFFAKLCEDTILTPPWTHNRVLCLHFSHFVYYLYGTLINNKWRIASCGFGWEILPICHQVWWFDRLGYKSVKIKLVKVV